MGNAETLRDRADIATAFLRAESRMERPNGIGTANSPSWLDWSIDELYYRFAHTSVETVAGYCDQAHFIHEFTRATGESPTKFLAQRNFMSHFYNHKIAR